MKKVMVFGLALAVIFAVSAFSDDDNEIKTQGTIQDFSDTHITVNGMTFVIDSDTEFDHGSKSDMAVGVMVKVEGHDDDGTLIADDIEFKDDDDGGDDDGGDDDNGKQVKAFGQISSVAGNDFTVNGTTFTVNDDTKFDHGSRGDLAEGRMVKVEGYENNGTIFAHEVEFKDGDDDNGDDDSGDDEDDEIEVKGVVTAVENDTFSVGGTQFTITPSTRFFRMSQSDLVVGVFVEAEGEVKSGGVIEAVKVKLEDDDDRGESSETGVLASVQNNGSELLELTFENGEMLYVDEDTSLSGRHGLKSLAKDLIPGLTIRLKFKVSKSSSDDSRGEGTHLSVIGNDEVKGYVSGAGTSSVEGSFMVGGREVKYDKRTNVQGDTKANSPEEIPNGQYVVVLANPLADGSFLANRIVATDEDDDDDDYLGRKVKFYGTVSALTGNGSLEGFSIGEQSFDVDGSTDFEVKGCDEPFDPAMLAEGMSVRVIAIEDGSGGYIAKDVNVLLPAYKFTGPIDAISTTSLTLLGVQMAITPDTEFDDVNPAELTVGTVVEVKAVLWPDDSLIACEIELEDEDNQEFEVKGTISEKSVDGNNVLVKVGGLTIVIEPGTDISSNNMMLTTDDLAVGVYVQVSGYISNTNEYVAKYVKIK